MSRIEVENSHLKEELEATRKYLQSIIEEQRTTNEELRSANEEIQSSNEELQSLNEELETSKEELQSTNEELITVNQELLDRNDQLNMSRIYAEAIVTTIHEPFLILSHDFKIISANKSFCKHFSIPQEQATGKSFFELENRQWEIPGMRDQFQKIQTGDESFVEWEITYTFPSAGTRTICFN